MQPHITTLRAIASSYVRRFVLPIFAIAGGISIVLIGIGGWLVYAVDRLWLLLLVPLVIWSLLLLIVWIAVSLALRVLSPRVMSRTDRRSVYEFIDTFNGVAEVAATPKVLIGARVVYDAIIHRNTAYLSETIGSARGLTTKYRALVERFSK